MIMVPGLYQIKRFETKNAQDNIKLNNMCSYGNSAGIYDTAQMIQN